jgi:hypothetical protein
VPEIVGHRVPGIVGHRVPEIVGHHPRGRPLRAACRHRLQPSARASSFTAGFCEWRGSPRHDRAPTIRPGVHPQRQESTTRTVAKRGTTVRVVS